MVKITLYGGPGCALCAQLRNALLTRIALPFAYKQAAAPENFAHLARLKAEPRALPVLEIEDKIWKASDLFPQGRMIPVFREDVPEGYEGLVLAELIGGKE
jgi:hypothetical protein